MCKYWTSLIQQIIHAEFDASFDDPAERTVVMVNDIVDKERVIKIEFRYEIWRGWDLRREFTGLKGNPSLFEGQLFVLSEGGGVN